VPLGTNRQESKAFDDDDDDEYWQKQYKITLIINEEGTEQ